jgi:hypothetical protein
MELNINIISEFPDKHHTEIVTGVCTTHIMYYVNNISIFSFYPERNYIYFKNIEDICLISDILDIIIIGVYIRDGLYYAFLDNNEKLKDLINNHTLSDEEKIAFKDYLCAYKLKFID